MGPLPVSPRAALCAARGLASALLALAPVATAHSPHDISYLVEVSPDFARDHTVFAAFTLTEHQLLGRSHDAGRSWELYAPPMMAHGLTRIALSPGFAGDRTLFASSPVDGVFRSSDGGDSWQPIQVGLTDLGVTDLALSPDFVADHTLLAVTGSGCFRSIDGGDSWLLSSTGLAPEPIRAVAFATADVAFASGKIMHRSDDAGVTWTAVQSFTFAARSIAASPDYAKDSSVAVCFGRYGDGIRASLDGGANWAPLTEGLTDAFVNELAFASDGTVFAVTRQEGCFRAPSLGAPFVLLNEGFEHHSEQTSSHYQGVAVSPGYALDHTVFVAAFEGLHRSENGGDLWKQLDVYSQRINRRVIMASDAAGQRELLLGNYGGGLQVSRPLGPTVGARNAAQGFATSPGSIVPAAFTGGALAPLVSAAPSGLTQPAALAWSARSDGLGALWTEVLESSPDYAHDGTLLLGHIGLWLSTDRGQSWSQLAVPPWPLPIRAAAFSPQWTTDHTLFVARQQGGVFRSTDGGANWTLLDDGLPFDDSMSFIRLSEGWPLDPVTLISGKSGNIYRSLDGGESWSACGGLPGSEVRALALSPGFPRDRTALAGTAGDGVYLSTDAAGTWAPSNAGLPAGIPLIVEGLALSPDFAADGTAFLSLLTGGVYRSTDFGRNWSLVSEDLPLAAPRVLDISPAYSEDGTLVLLTHDWAWSSQDQGAHWSRLPGYIRVDDSHPALVYGGAWTPVLAPGVTGVGHRVNDTAADFVELEFRGRSIEWFAQTGPSEGSVYVLIDGQPVAMVNLSQAMPSNQAMAFSQSFPSLGWHTIRIVNLGVVAGNRNARVCTDGFAYGF